VFKQDETRRFLPGGKCSRGKDRRYVEIDYKIKKKCSMIVIKSVDIGKEPGKT
jgi:hypothetical protein